MKTLITAFFLFFLVVKLTAQDSLRLKSNVYISLNPVLFVDFKGFNSYPGLDVNVGLQDRILFGEVGILGGNSFPVLPNLNYYLATGIAVPVSSLLEVQPRFRFMLSYFSETDSQSHNKTTRREESLNAGAAMFVKFKHLKLGVEYYSWWSNYSYTFEPGYSAIGTTSDIRHGFVPTGILSLKMIYKLNKRNR